MNKNIVVFDIETTGLNYLNDRVIELAAIKVIDGEIVDKLVDLIAIDKPLNPFITNLTGITNVMLKNNGITEQIAFPRFRDFIGDSLLVAHNAAFDLSFLHYGLLRNGLETFSNDFIDTLTISRERYPHPHKLENMCDRFGIELTGAHRALNDVIATWNLLKKLHSEADVTSYKNKLGYLSKYGPNGWYPKHAEVFETENFYERFA